MRPFLIATILCGAATGCSADDEDKQSRADAGPAEAGSLDGGPLEAGTDSGGDVLADVLADVAAEAGQDAAGDVAVDAGPTCWQLMSTGWPKSVSVDPGGGLALGGIFASDMTLGGMALTGTAQETTFLSRISDGGQVEWLERLPVKGTGVKLRFSANGHLAAGGTYSGSLQGFGSAVLAEPNPPQAGETKAFAGLLEATGDAVWMRGVDLGAQPAFQPDANGHLTYGAYAGEDVELVQGHSFAKGEWLAARFDPAGEIMWSTAVPTASSLAVNDTGITALGGVRWGEDGDGGIVADTLAFAMLTPDGALAWEHVIPVANCGNDSYVVGTAFTNSERVVFVGQYANSIDLGGGPLAAEPCGRNVFLAQFDTSGTHIWSRGITVPPYEYPDLSKRFYVGALAVAPNGDILIAGIFGDTINFGDDPSDALVPTEQVYDPGLEFFNEDIFIARFDSDGNHLWSRAVGGSTWSAKRVHDMAVEPDGSIVLVGDVWMPEEPADLGCGPMPAPLSYYSHGFVIRYGPGFFEE
ncbi:MAG: hypothetical protein ACOC1F_10005 [Myxococcota bacterium]